MSNSIKYDTSYLPQTLRKGNYSIGVGDAPKGPTSTTGFYSCIVPPSGGYSVYLYKAEKGPAVYCPPNDADLISLTNRIAQANYTTVEQCLAYYGTQSDKVIFNRDYEPIITDGLVSAVDAGFTLSYPRSGSSLYSLGDMSFNGVAANTPTWSSESGGIFTFDGTDDYVSVTNNLGISTVNITNSITVQMAIRMPDFAVGANSQTQIFDIGATPNIYRNQFWTPGFFGSFTWYKNTSNTFSNVFLGYYARLFPSVWTVLTFTLGADGSYAVYTNGVRNNFGTASSFQSWGLGGLSPASTVTCGGQAYDFSHLYIYDRALSSAEVLQNYNAVSTRFI